MVFLRNRRPRGNRRPEQDHEEHWEPQVQGDPTGTGSEAQYLHSLVSSRMKVTVILKTGERLRGRIRYYDRDCFSLGPDGGGAKILLPKHSIHSISED